VSAVYRTSATVSEEPALDVAYRPPLWARICLWVCVANFCIQTARLTLVILEAAGAP